MSIATEIERLQTAKADIKSAIEGKGVTVGDGNIDTYAEKISEITAGGGDITQNPMYYMAVKGFQWNAKAFPEGFNFVLNVRDKPDDLNAAFMRTTGVKSITLICEAEGTVNFAQLIRESTAETLDITNFKPIPTSIAYLAYINKNLVSILGELDLSSCTTATSPFGTATALKEVRFKAGTISISISFANCSLLTDTSIQSIIDGLADLTGGTAQKIEFHSTIGDNLTEEQLLQIWSKNWTTE